MIRYEPFKPDHLDGFNWKFNESIDCEVWKEMALASVNNQYANACTIFVDDKIAGLIGYVYIFPKVIEFWSYFSDAIKTKPIELVKNMRKIINSVLVNKEIKRAQINVLNHDRLLHKWAKLLGFKFEAVLSNYGSDCKDYAMYVRLN